MPTFLSILALLIALAALAYGWKLQQEMSTAARRLDRYNRALFDANDEMRGLRADLERSNAELKVAIMRGGSGLHFAPETTVQEAELMHPQVTEVLASFHMGGCDSCAVNPGNTLAQICAERDLPVESLLANLNMLVAGDNATGAPTHVKIPNMVLEID